MVVVLGFSEFVCVIDFLINEVNFEIVFDDNICVWDLLFLDDGVWFFVLICLLIYESFDDEMISVLSSDVIFVFDIWDG